MKGRKVIVLLVIALILVNSVALPVFASPDADTVKVVYGDVDNDGNFDSDDYALMRQYLLGMIGIERVAATADVDGNGRFNSDDYAYMRQHLLGMIQVFPVEKSSPSPVSTPTSTATATATPTFTPTPTTTIPVIATAAPTSTPLPTSTPTPTAEVKELFINSVKESNDIVKVIIYINSIANFSGYQANLVYDPEVLKPVYADGSEFDMYSTVQSAALLNKQYSPIDFARHDLQNGILNFGRAYMAINSYKNSGIPEHTGSIAAIYFKMLKQEVTQIRLSNCDTMPEANNGTILTDWNGNQIFNYHVAETHFITPYMPTHTPTPFSTPTPTPTNTIAPTAPPIILPTLQPPVLLSTLSMSAEKVTNSSSDLFKVTINVQNTEALAGFEANLKYDPYVLKPVYLDGSEYESGSTVEDGTLFINKNFSPIKLAYHDLDNGQLTFGTAYIDAISYKNSGVAETKGSVAVIYFKVLENIPTNIKLTDCATLPTGINGTTLFNWDSSQIFNYTVFPVLTINPSNTIPTPGPTSTPLPYTPSASSTAVATTTPVPSSGSFGLSVDKSGPLAVGDIVTVSLNASNIDKLSGIQANIKYDPACIQPVYLSEGSYIPYDESTIPSKADLFQKAFSTLEVAGNDILNGIINFGFSYLNLSGYINSQKPEGNGTAAKISFKVLKDTSTRIELSPGSNMPGSTSGIYAFDWFGNQIKSFAVNPSYVELNNASN